MSSKQFFHKTYLYSISRFNKLLQRILPSSYLLPVRLAAYKIFRGCCRDKNNPVIYYTDGSWIDRNTTTDQLLIEEYLSGIGIDGKSLLHVGIGNSSLARKHHKKLALIDGVTILTAEKELADSFNIPGYQVYIFNKYEPENILSGNKYDLIVDNNLSSYACCYHHFIKMFENYLSLLKPGGKIVTCRIGLEYYTSGFGMTYEDLRKLESLFPVSVSKAGDEVILLTVNR